MIVASIDDKQVQLNLKNLNKFAVTAPKKALLDVGLELLRLSQQQVPLDKGTLQNSGDVTTRGDIVYVGYHTPYAHRLHEHPEYHFQHGRKGKYLTDPAMQNSEVFRQHMKGDLQISVVEAIHG